MPESQIVQTANNSSQPLEVKEFPLPSGAVLTLKEGLKGDLFIDFTKRSLKIGAEAQKGILPKLFELTVPGEEEAPSWPVFLAGLDLFDGVALFGQNGALVQATTPLPSASDLLPSGRPYGVKNKVPLSVFDSYQQRAGKGFDNAGRVSNADVVAEAQMWLATKIFDVDGNPFDISDLLSFPFMDTAVLIAEAVKCVTGTRTR